MKSHSPEKCFQSADLKKKLLAAKQFGIKQVLIPIKNKRDLVDMPKNIQEGIDIIFVKNVEEVLAHALMK